MTNLSPNKDEQLKDFINRCMNNKAMQEEYFQNDQRFTVCNNCWEKANLDKNSAAFEVEAAPIQQIKLAKAEMMDISAILGNLIQMQQQYRVFHWQTKNQKENESFSKACLVADSKLENLIETLLNKYNQGIEDKEYSLELFDFKDKTSCIAACETYNDFLGSLNALLKSEDTKVFESRDEAKIAVKNIVNTLRLN